MASQRSHPEGKGVGEEITLMSPLMKQLYLRTVLASDAEQCLTTNKQMTNQRETKGTKMNFLVSHLLKTGNYLCFRAQMRQFCLPAVEID